MSNDITPWISLITTCKGRLHHLRHTLPSMLAQVSPDPHEVVVVDYECPDGTFDWCRSLNAARLVSVRVSAASDEFNRSHARNCGAQVARGSILAFVDADMRLQPGWAATAADPIRCGMAQLVTVSHFGPDGWDRGGTCLVTASLFHEVRGYDESLRGWGVEDADFYQRCGAIAPCGRFPAGLVLPIKHGHADRVRFHDQKDLGASSRENQERVWRRIGPANASRYGDGVVEVHRGLGDKLPPATWWNSHRFRRPVRRAESR